MSRNHQEGCSLEDSGNCFSTERWLVPRQKIPFPSSTSGNSSDAGLVLLGRPSCTPTCKPSGWSMTTQRDAFGIPSFWRRVEKTAFRPLFGGDHQGERKPQTDDQDCCTCAGLARQLSWKPCAEPSKVYNFLSFRVALFFQRTEALGRCLRFSATAPTPTVPGEMLAVTCCLLSLCLRQGTRLWAVPK